MASIDVDVHPDPEGIRAQRYTASLKEAFSTLDIGVGVGAGATRVSIFVSKRPVLDALQAALDTIRADMDASEAPVIAPLPPANPSLMSV